MVELGEGWVVEDDRVFHVCGPDVRGPLSYVLSHCDCGVRIPRHVQLFIAWVVIVGVHDLRPTLNPSTRPRPR